MRKFDFYEFAGVIIPGAVLLLAAAAVWPDYLKEVKGPEISAGALGILLVVAYTTGQLLQSVGNVLESLWWRLWGGWPSDWPRRNKGRLLGASQRAKLQERIRTEFAYTNFEFNEMLTASDWQGIYRQVYAAVRAAGHDDRAHVFNGNYGMFRGIAAAAIVGLAMIVTIRGCAAWPMALVFVVVTILALTRMHRFAKHYAQETLVQFLALPVTPRNSQ